MASLIACAALRHTLLIRSAWPPQSFVGDFSTVLNPSKNSGLNSSIYAFLTAAFVLSGLSYQFAPVQTLTAIFGSSAGKGLEDVYLWQLLGGGLATSVGPIAYTQRVSLCRWCMSYANADTVVTTTTSQSVPDLVMLVTLQLMYSLLRACAISMWANYTLPNTTVAGHVQKQHHCI